MTTGNAVRSIMLGIVVRGALVAVALALVAGVIGGILVGWPGVLGALIGAFIAFVFFAVTAAAMYFTAESSPSVLAATVLGSFLLKMVFLIGAVMLLKPLDFYDPWVLFITLVVGAFASLAVDVVTVNRAKLPIIDEK